MKTLLALFTLLLLTAGTAWADCSWVAWGQYLKNPGMVITWFPGNAFENKKDCEADADKENDKSAAYRENHKKEGPLEWLPQWYCYPGTLDPRPRGK